MPTTTEPEWCAQDLAVAFILGAALGLSGIAFITAGRALLEALAHDREAIR